MERLKHWEALAVQMYKMAEALREYTVYAVKVKEHQHGGSPK